MMVMMMMVVMLMISAYLPEDSPPSRYSAMAEGGSYCLLSCVIHSCRTRGIVFSLPVVLIYKNMICQQR